MGYSLSECLQSRAIRGGPCASSARKGTSLYRKAFRQDSPVENEAAGCCSSPILFSDQNQTDRTPVFDRREAVYRLRLFYAMPSGPLLSMRLMEMLLYTMSMEMMLTRGPRRELELNQGVEVSQGMLRIWPERSRTSLPHCFWI